MGSQIDTRTMIVSDGITSTSSIFRGLIQSEIHNPSVILQPSEQRLWDMLMDYDVEQVECNDEPLQQEDHLYSGEMSPMEDLPPSVGQSQSRFQAENLLGDGELDLSRVTPVVAQDEEELRNNNNDLDGSDDEGHSNDPSPTPESTSGRSPEHRPICR